MSTCILTGTIIDSSETAVAGALVFAVPAKSPAVTSTGKAIYPQPVQAVTTATGEFELTLIRNMEFVVSIPYIGFREKIRVPDENTYDLFNTTSVSQVVDPTPNDDNPEDDW